MTLGIFASDFAETISPSAFESRSAEQAVKSIIAKANFMSFQANKILELLANSDVRWCQKQQIIGESLT